MQQLSMVTFHYQVSRLEQSPQVFISLHLTFDSATVLYGVWSRGYNLFHGGN